MPVLEIVNNNSNHIPRRLSATGARTAARLLSTAALHERHNDMTSYQIPEPKSMNANAAIRWMLNHNGGQYPALIKTNRGVILKKQHDATGSAEYIGVNHTGHWMTATRAVSLIADGVAEPVNAVIVETQQNTEVNAQ